MTAIETSKTVAEKPTVHLGGLYAPKNGSFSAFSISSDKKTVKASYRPSCDSYWYGCREEFLWYSFKGNTTKFLFSHAGGNHDNLVKFMDILQDKLELKHEDRLLIKPTAHPSISIIFLSDWWAKESVRRAVLTIFLRCGMNFKGNFEDALYSYDYAKRTKPAIEAFLDGRTLLSGRVEGGWVIMFNVNKPKSKKDLADRYVSASVKQHLNNMRKLVYPA